MATLTEIRRQQILQQQQKPDPEPKPEDKAPDNAGTPDPKKPEKAPLPRDLAGREISYARLMGQGWKKRHARAERKALNASRMGEITAYRNRFLAAKEAGHSDEDANRIASGAEPLGPSVEIAPPVVAPAPAPEPIIDTAEAVAAIKTEVDPSEIEIEVEAEPAVEQKPAVSRRPRQK